MSGRNTKFGPMAGKNKNLCHCRVPGHSTNCAVALEILEKSKGRSREKRELRAEIDSAILDHEADRSADDY